MKTLRFEREFNARLDSFDDAYAFIHESLETAHLTHKEEISIRLATEEIFVNVAHYAYQDNKGMVKIEVEVFKDKVAITFSDEGIEFNPLEKEDPDISLGYEEREIGGLGILMVKKCMDELNYKRENDTNYFTMIKYISNKGDNNEE